MADHAVALQTAIYAVLSQDAGLIALIGDGASPERARVYDVPPPGTAFGYVTIGDDNVTEYGDKSKNRQRWDVTIQAWDRADENSGGHRGRKTVKAMLAAIYTALHRQTLTVSGAVNIRTTHEFADTFHDVEGQTWRGVTRFTVVLEDS